MTYELEDLDLSNTPETPSFDQPIQYDPKGLESLDIDQELYTQYMDTKEFLKQLFTADSEYPPNQVIAVANSLRALLTDITKLRTDLYNAERLKALEAAVILCLKDAPESVKDKFFTEYERSVEMLRIKK